jgi:diguanylate cyclase (GGDEF)-like protein
LSEDAGILIVDDNPNNLRVLESILGDAGYRVRAALDGNAALRSAASNPPALILLDIRMPDMDGYEVCRRLKAQPETRDLPVIFISALQETEDKVFGFRVGAVDYIVKPFQSDEVLARVRTHVELAHTKHSLAVANAQLQVLLAERTAALASASERIDFITYNDELTGLANRARLTERVADELRRSDRHKSMFAVILIDLDHFKQVNEVLGHACGDAYLKIVAQRLGTIMRSGDVLCRWGGDEFVILALDLGREPERVSLAAHAVASKALSSLGEAVAVADQTVQLDASIGIALYPGDGDSPQELLQRAELAMFRAKELDGHAIQFFEAGLQEEARRRLNLEKDLRQAVAQNQFLLHYQPQVDPAGQLIGAEALVRWQHPSRGLVPPGEFIPICEESGLIVQLGNWVLGEGCRQMQAWLAAGTAPLQLAINVSARQFHQPDFVDTVLASLNASGLPPARLELEVTESLLLVNVEGAVARMNELRAIGVRFSIDDFGTGYSSLSYLRRLPLDQLKIDRSFVTNVHREEKNAVIVRSIISLAQNLGMKTIAEGVEQPEEAAFLREAGCDHFQGYLFSRPLPPEEFASRWNPSS